MTLNGDLVRERCNEIAESLARLDALARMPKDSFLANRDAQDIACYRLLVAIEAALSVCYHWCARQLRVTPEDYATCFATLADAGAIPRDLAERLQRMARFRNLLVHMYWKLDYGRVYEALQQDLDDLRSFCTIAARQV